MDPQGGLLYSFCLNLGVPEVGPEMRFHVHLLVGSQEKLIEG